MATAERAKLLAKLRHLQSAKSATTDDKSSAKGKATASSCSLPKDRDVVELLTKDQAAAKRARTFTEEVNDLSTMLRSAYPYTDEVAGTKDRSNEAVQKKDEKVNEADEKVSGGADAKVSNLTDDFCYHPPNFELPT